MKGHTLNPIVVIGFYPVAAVSLAVALLAMRLGRSVGRGLMLLCGCLALWVIGLILAMTPAAAPWATRVIPCGMLLAGGFVHAFSEVAQLTARRAIAAAWAFGIAVSLLGILVPGALYQPDTNRIGPAFWPVGILAIIGTLTVASWMLRHTLAVHGIERRKRAVLFVANLLGALGGGGVIVLRVLDWGPMALAAPLLLVSVVLASSAVLSEEKGRHREMLIQGLWFALATAVLSAVGLTVFYWLLPVLLPFTDKPWAWTAWVIFVAALPLEPLRQLVVDQLGRLFERPIAVPALARELERSVAQAQHSEQLADIGKLASVVAHEIRNPLSVILAQARMLEREGANTQRVLDVRTQVQRATHFVEELLHYSKPRALTLTTVDVCETYTQAARNVELAQHAAVFNIQPESELNIEADFQAVLDTATILLSNAAIAVEDLNEPRVSVYFTQHDETVTVTVEDNGPGVPPELETKLFQMFVTGRGRDHKHPGTGLGLARAAQHVQRHGGSIRYQPAPSGGARFIVTWPKRAVIFG